MKNQLSWLVLLMVALATINNSIATTSPKTSIDISENEITDDIESNIALEDPR
jgi:hypothetical protein